MAISWWHLGNGVLCACAALVLMALALGRRRRSVCGPGAARGVAAAALLALVCLGASCAQAQTIYSDPNGGTYLGDGSGIASGVDSTVVGANGASATGTNSTAIGAGALSSGANSVAIGAGSTDGGQANVFSVGSPTQARTIINVAPGAVASGSTDVVTGGQLYTTNQNVAAAQSTANNAATTATAAQSTASSAQATANSAQTTANAASTTANAAQSTANAAQSAASSAQSTANSALGLAQNSVQYDDATHASVTLNPGGSSPAGLHHVAAATLSATSTDAVNGSQLYAVAQGVGALGASTAAALGGGATYDAASGAITPPSYTVGGLTYNTVGGALSGLDAAIASSPAGLVQQPGGASAAVTVGAQTGGTQVSVAGTAGDRRVSGVAAGVAGNDAVNLGQMNQAIEQAGSSTLGQANAYTQAQVSGLADQIANGVNEAKRYADRGVAAAMAMPAVPMLNAGDRWAGAAVSSYGSAQAIGVAMAYQPTEGMNIAAGISTSTHSGGSVGLRLQVGYRW